MSTNHNIRLNNSEKSAMHVHYYPEIVRSITPFPIPLSLGNYTIFREYIKCVFSFLIKLWVPLIKFMMGPTTYVRGRNTHLIYSRNT